MIHQTSTRLSSERPLKHTMNIVALYRAPRQTNFHALGALATEIDTSKLAAIEADFVLFLFLSSIPGNERSGRMDAAVRLSAQAAQRPTVVRQHITFCHGPQAPTPRRSSGESIATHLLTFFCSASPPAVSSPSGAAQIPLSYST